MCYEVHGRVEFEDINSIVDLITLFFIENK